MIKIELLSTENFNLDSLDHYPRKQDVKKVYRKLNGEYILVGRGIGRKLFDEGKKEARKAGTEALYISACSSEETSVFYKAMGAELTEIFLDFKSIPLAWNRRCNAKSVKVWAHSHDTFYTSYHNS